MKLPIKWIVGMFVKVIPHLSDEILQMVLRAVLIQMLHMNPDSMADLSKVLRSIRPGDEGPEEYLADIVDKISGMDTRKILDPSSPELHSEIVEEEVH